MYQTKVMSSPVKVRAQTEPGKDEDDKPATEKTAAGKKGGGGSENPRVIHRRGQEWIAAFTPGHVLTKTIQGGGYNILKSPYPLSRHAACTNYNVTIIVT